MDMPSVFYAVRPMNTDRSDATRPEEIIGAPPRRWLYQLRVTYTRSRHSGTRRNGREEPRSRKSALGFTGCASASASRSEDPRTITIHVIDPRRGFVSASVPQLIRADTFFRDRRGSGNMGTRSLAGIYGRAARRDTARKREAEREKRQRQRIRSRVRIAEKGARNARIERYFGARPMTDRADSRESTRRVSFAFRGAPLRFVHRARRRGAARYLATTRCTASE